MKLSPEFWRRIRPPRDPLPPVPLELPTPGEVAMALGLPVPLPKDSKEPDVVR